MKSKVIILGATCLALFSSGCAMHELRPNFTPIREELDKAAMNPTILTPVVLTAPDEPEPGSLWRPGSRTFFNDSRARRVGDILTVLVSEEADAEVEAETEVKRTHNQESGITNILKTTAGALTNPAITTAANNLVNTDSDRSFKGEGDTSRNDKVTGRIAAVVTQVLPNGYLVVQGKREVVVNYELQELSIKGIVRPEDITADNTIASEKIAEARVFYAGRGLVDESQTPSYGVRFLDKILAF